MGKWKEVKFSEIVDNFDGKRIPIKASERKKLSGGKYPYYGASGIIDYVDDFIFEGEHLLISEDGANLLARVYPIAFKANGKFWVNNHAHIVNAKKDKTTNNYLEYYFASIDISKYVTGSAQPKLNQKKLNSIKIPLPPLPEQQRIVAKLDGLFTKIDQAIGLLEENIVHTQALMGSVLDEELSGLYYDLSLWENKTWKDVLEVKNGKNQKAVLNPNGKYPIYGSGGIMNYADDYLCNENTVIIGRKGTINKPIYVETKFWNVDTAFGLESKENLLPRFLYFFCIHFNFMTLNKSTTLPSLAKRDLLEIEINLPPLEIQTKILSKLEEINNFKDNIIETQTKKLTHLKALKSSLLDQAFRGEL